MANIEHASTVRRVPVCDTRLYCVAVLFIPYIVEFNSRAPPLFSSHLCIFFVAIKLPLSIGNQTNSRKIARTWTVVDAKGCCRLYYIVFDFWCDAATLHHPGGWIFDTQKQLANETYANRRDAKTIEMNTKHSIWVQDGHVWCEIVCVDVTWSWVVVVGHPNAHVQITQTSNSIPAQRESI